MTNESLLIIDDEASIRSSLRGILEDEGYRVRTVATGEDGLAELRKGNYGLVVLDIWLPAMGGLEVLAEIQRLDDRPAVVVISGHGTVEAAVRATKLGAFDFLEKPLTLDKVVITVKNALRQRRLEEENVLLRERFQARYQLVGRSPALQRLRAEIRKVAPTNGRILITGENGTGKELLARLIHQQSRRQGKRFVEINCAAIPDDLIESELFGLLQPPGPAAARDKKGKLLLADGGTLFLDEIGEMSLKTQAKLVRAIIAQRFEPLGGAEPVAFDARIIAASSRDLKDLIHRGKFKEDLFFKLNVIPLKIPPLRERTEDIPLLIAYFLRTYAAEYGKRPKTMHKDALKAFMNYAWPGNVSELMNVIERFVIMVEEEEIGPGHLALLVETREAEGIPADRPLSESVGRFERKIIRSALVRTDWDLDRAAGALGLTVEALRDKVEAYGITFMD
ncbi:MAG: sigma-54-dependent Fis family transcriptional regulator [Candidatus Aminicenantes bacterium]|nr:sigma-54-dependent Fis family transcriptional regulator [Candidatus Aminicenantes bacterium]